MNWDWRNLALKINAQRIRNNIGEYVEIDREADNLNKSYLRLKVVLDTKKSLMADF